MLRDQLQKYLDKVYPYSRLDTEHTLGGQIQIRFELGGKHKNGTIERVDQAVKRACALFNDTFPNKENEIWVVIYEYEGRNFYNCSNTYLHKQFPEQRFESFYNEKERVFTPYFITDENGKEVLEKDEARLIIGQITISEINIEGILRGIANTEMGFDPGIDQSIFFFDRISNKAFQMYDDRGCYVWSNKADSIRNIYKRRNEWIVDDERTELEQLFL